MSVVYGINGRWLSMTHACPAVSDVENTVLAGLLCRCFVARVQFNLLTKASSLYSPSLTPYHAAQFHLHSILGSKCQLYYVQRQGRIKGFFARVIRIPPAQSGFAICCYCEDIVEKTKKDAVGHDELERSRGCQCWSSKTAKTRG